MFYVFSYTPSEDDTEAGPRSMETQYTPVLKEFAVFIKDIGFPIFVALWVLLITSRDTKYLTTAINRLTAAFEKANIHLNQKNKEGDQ